MTIVEYKEKLMLILSVTPIDEENFKEAMLTTISDIVLRRQTAEEKLAFFQELKECVLREGDFRCYRVYIDLLNDVLPESLLVEEKGIIDAWLKKESGSVSDVLSKKSRQESSGPWSLFHKENAEQVDKNEQNFVGHNDDVLWF